MARKSSRDRGFEDGLAGCRIDRIRTYDSEKAEKAYWDAYRAGMAQANPGKWIVQCEREGRIFAVNPNPEYAQCPTCGRRYMKEGNVYMSDRKLTILVGDLLLSLMKAVDNPPA